MPAWFVVFYEQYVRQRLEMVNMIREGTQQRMITGPAYGDSKGGAQAKAVGVPAQAPEGQWLDEHGEVVDPLVYRKMSLNITMLEGGILFHSVFVGMTISITNGGFIILLIAILFHQMFEGLGLGSRIAAVPYPPKSIRPWVLVVAFGTTAPIGQAIGLAARGSYDPDSAFGLIIVGVFNAM
jgi:zinc transporter ZupT